MVRFVQKRLRLSANVDEWMPLMLGDVPLKALIVAYHAVPGRG